MASAVIKMIGTTMSAGGQAMQGIAEEKKSKFVAKQLRRNAKAMEAKGQRSARQEREAAEETKSSTITQMAAGGGGIDTEMLADIEQQGDYNALAALYESGTQADIMREEARMVRAEGKQKRRESRLGAVSTMMSGAGSSMGSMGK